MKLTCACEVTPLKTEILLNFSEGSFDYHQHAGDGQTADILSNVKNVCIHQHVIPKPE